MVWIAVDKDGTECIYMKKPKRRMSVWLPSSKKRDTLEDYAFYDYGVLPKGSIKKLIGRELKWEDEPVKLS